MSSSTLASLFEAHAAARPDAPALMLDGVSLTYAEPNARANQLASRLRKLRPSPSAHHPAPLLHPAAPPRHPRGLRP